jgi:2'-5' RNA ligase
LAEADGDTLRAFIAVKIPKKAMTAISAVQQELRSYRLHIKWVRLQSIHLTLKFLGNIQKDKVPRISEMMAAAAKGTQALALTAKGIGVFPTIRRPRVIWIGLSGDTAGLLELQKDLEEKLAAIGFPKDKRSFKAHLTLGRVKGRIDPKELMAAMEPFLLFQGDTFRAEGITLYRSELKPSGAEYTPLAETAFLPMEGSLTPTK